MVVVTNVVWQVGFNINIRNMAGRIVHNRSNNSCTQFLTSMLPTLPPPFLLGFILYPSDSHEYDLVQEKCMWMKKQGLDEYCELDNSSLQCQRLKTWRATCSRVISQGSYSFEVTFKDFQGLFFFFFNNDLLKKKKPALEEDCPYINYWTFKFVFCFPFSASR